MKMNKKVKKLWVEALRSGEYKQTDGQLRNVHNSFCCLGVLCNLHAQAHPHIAAKQKSPIKYMDNTGVLPDPVQRWAGLEGNWGADVTIKGEYLTLIIHNDNGRTFKQIANAIEKQL
jgi:hypothetical protein